jgi:hypothetical protein
VVTSRQTPVFDPAEARALLDCIDASTHVGSRDRALIGLIFIRSPGSGRRSAWRSRDGAGLRDDPKGPLFRTIGRGTGKLTRTVLAQANAYAMILGARLRPASRQSLATQLPGNRDHGLSQEWRHL